MTHHVKKSSPRRKSSGTKKAKKASPNKRSSSGSKCRDYLGKKIKINMEEYKKGVRHSSEKQAIAVSYAQTFKAKPSCKKVLAKKSPRKK